MTQPTKTDQENISHEEDGMLLPPEIMFMIMEQVVIPYNLTLICKEEGTEFSERDEASTNIPTPRLRCRFEGFPQGALGLRSTCKLAKKVMDVLLLKCFRGRLAIMVTQHQTTVSRATINHLGAHPLAAQVHQVWTNLNRLGDAVPVTGTFTNLRSVRFTEYRDSSCQKGTPVVGECVHIRNDREFPAYITWTGGYFGASWFEREMLYLEQLTTMLSHLRWGSDRPGSSADIVWDNDRIGIKAGCTSVIDVELKWAAVGHWATYNWEPCPWSGLRAGVEREVEIIGLKDTDCEPRCVKTFPSHLGLPAVLFW